MCFCEKNSPVFIKVLVFSFFNVILQCGDSWMTFINNSKVVLKFPMFESLSSLKCVMEETMSKEN